MTHRPRRSARLAEPAGRSGGRKRRRRDRLVRKRMGDSSMEGLCEKAVETAYGTTGVWLGHSDDLSYFGNYLGWVDVGVPGT